MVRYSKRGATFGEWLEITLDNKGVTGRELGELIGVHEATVSRWRTGKALPGIDDLGRLADILGLDKQRLVVTADHPAAQLLDGVQPYPMPTPTAQRESIRRQIANIKGLSEIGRVKLLDTYDSIVRDMEEETA